MSTDRRFAGRREIDDPWQRLHWTLPAALALWAALLMGAARFIDDADVRLPEPPAIEAQLIEIPPPPPSAPVAKTAAPHPVKPQAPAPRAQAHVSLPIQTTKAPADAQPTPAPPSPPPKEIPSAPDNKLAGNSGAHAIACPPPQLPDEFRQDALNITVGVRFHIAADGSTSVELSQPTPNIKLNRWLLATLKNCRFFPAMRDGQPVSSDLSINYKLDVQ